MISERGADITTTACESPRSWRRSARGRASLVAVLAIESESEKGSGCLREASTVAIEEVTRRWQLLLGCCLDWLVRGLTLRLWGRSMDAWASATGPARRFGRRSPRAGWSGALSLLIVQSMSALRPSSLFANPAHAARDIEGREVRMVGH